MVLEVNSGHTSSQENEPLLCPLFNMDVTPAGYRLSPGRNYFSTKMKELELCPGRAAKNTALWGTSDWGTEWPPSSPFSPQEGPTPVGHPPGAPGTASCLSLVPALSEGKSPGHRACFTDGQTEVQTAVLHPQNHRGSRSEGAGACHPTAGRGRDAISVHPSTSQFTVSSSCCPVPTLSYKTRTCIVPTLQAGLKPGEVRTQGEIRGKGRASTQGFRL